MKKQPRHPSTQPPKRRTSDLSKPSKLTEHPSQNAGSVCVCARARACVSTPPRPPEYLPSKRESRAKATGKAEKPSRHAHCTSWNYPINPSAATASFPQTPGFNLLSRYPISQGLSWVDPGVMGFTRGGCVSACRRVDWGRENPCSLLLPVSIGERIGFVPGEVCSDLSYTYSPLHKDGRRPPC